MTINKNEKLNPLFLAIIGLAVLSGCGESDSTALEGNNQVIEREPLEKSCIPIAADGNQFLAETALGLNVDTTMLNVDPDGTGPMTAPVSIRTYITVKEGELGGKGVSATRTPGIGYFRAATAYSLYVCESLTASAHPLIADFDELAKAVYGEALFVSEVTELDALKSAVAAAGGTSQQQIISQCAALLSSFGAQCVK